MPIIGKIYFLDFFDGNGIISGRTPNVGGNWSGSGSTSDGHTNGGSQGSSNQSAPDPKYIEQVCRFRKTEDASALIQFGRHALGGSIATWTMGSGSNNDTLRVFAGSEFELATTIANSGPGIHEIRILGDADTLIVYFDGRGLRITGIPDTGLQDYDGIGFSSTLFIEIDELWGKQGVEPDSFVSFGGALVGSFSGSSGGGGGTGGVPNPGGSNPGNVPCDPGDTLIINDGAAVSVAPTDPCMWTGLIWWKLVCEEVLTEADYAVEAEVFFNTLTDPFMSVGVIARLNETTGGHYFAALWREEIVIGKKPSTAADDIIFTTKPLTLKPGTWYTIRLEVEGFTLRAYLNDELQLVAVDPNTSFGEPGCAGVRLSRGNPATDIRIDNFRVWLNVKRPALAEAPVFLDSLVVTKDDGMDVETSIVVADSFTALEGIGVITPKTVHINEGVVFTDKAGQVKRIQEFLLGLDSMDLGIGISVQDVLTAAEKLGLGMNIPVTDIISFTDEERTIHGVSDTVTVMEFLAQFLEGGVPDKVGASDSVRVTKTSVATYAPPEFTFYARDLKRLRIIEKGKKVR